MLLATRGCRPLLLAGVIGLSAGRLAAQGGSSSSNSALIIRGIEVVRHRIFDTAQATSAVYRAMNSLHATTRDYVIRQQLLFHVGDRWDPAEVAETARNLRSTGYFRVVTIDSIATDSGLIARVVTQDAWTFGIVFSIKSSGSEIGYAVGFNDRNLLGTGTQIQMQYGKNPDRDSVMFGLARKFALGTPYDLAINYNKLSDGKSGWMDFGLPFRTLESTKGMTLGGNLYNGRVLLFYGGDTAAADSVRRSFQLLSINPAIALVATPHRYLRLGLYAQIERNDFQPIDSSTASMPRTYTGAFGPFLTAGFPEYEHVRYFQAGGRREDIQLGYTATLGLYFAPGQWGYASNGIGPSFLFSAAQRVGRVILQESLTVTSLYGNSGLDSGTVYASLTAWWQPAPTHLLIGYAGGGAQKNGYPGENWDLGLGYAVRAFPQHSFTGDRVFITAGEYRWFFAPNFYRLLALGVAAFVDHAGAWYEGSPMRTGTDAGIGFRFSSIAGNPGYVSRADVAYRWATDALPGGWVFTFGKGFVWQVF